MATAGVSATAKHFPGLGRVGANPDTSSRVTDRVTVRHDAYLVPFANAVHNGLPFLMISTAYYQRIDPYHPAAFSTTVVGGMVRSDLGFKGVVISDDLGNAKQVAAWSPASRALRFVTVGGDMVLTVNPTLLPAMYNAVLAKAKSSSAFRAKINASALRVLTAKQHAGLIPAP
jgi:beta-N-acetylhexosaminidase